ncbi:coiled-coil domain-containing protein 81-like isoform X2 [Hoplias malabaricus]
MDIGSKHVLIQRPVFLLSERLLQSHGLKQTKPFAAGDIPVVPLNFTAISMDSSFDRDVVEGCVRETLLLLLRAVSAQHTVLFTFRSIGVLLFRHSCVKMKFYKDFVSSMDGTGKLLCALKNRPGTSCSVLSGKQSSLERSISSNAVLLPKIESQFETDGKNDSPSNPHDGQEENRTVSEIQNSPRHKSRQCIQERNAFCSTDNPDPTASPDKLKRFAGFSQPPEDDVGQVEKWRERSSALACHDHPRAGQELCYVCMQRAQRNVPLYLAAERRRNEQEEEKILNLVEQQKDEQFLQREHDEKEERRKIAIETAEFNLHKATLRGAEHFEGPSQSENYIFHRRPVSPPKLLRRRNFMQELMEQVTCRRQQKMQSQHYHTISGKLHQFQLAEEIAKLRSEELQQKKDKVESLKKALCTQLEYRGTGIPALQPDSDGPVFGGKDRVPAALAAQQQRAQTHYQQNLSMANTKKNEVLFNRVSEQRKERDMMERNRKELIADRLKHFNTLQKLQDATATSWSHSAVLKKRRDSEEEAFIRYGSGVLMEQCAQYRRCYHCKRTPGNRGESYFIPGSRMLL